MSAKAPANRLQNEKSPYLLQHAHNPVDWWPWCEEAFEKAKKEDKPVFLSIGYSTCHWCHVMEKESFEDPQVAQLMNEHMISIKVDREERPDIDQIYMTATLMVQGQGGWPLSVFLTPEKKPFMTATYIPRQARMGHQGMMELIPSIGQIWKKRRNEILESADRLIQAVQQSKQAGEGKEPSVELLNKAFDFLEKNFDHVHGGFGSAPKFPTPHQLLFLLRMYSNHGKSQGLEMVTHTLKQMRMGGIFDHVGYGFHRYSTDENWLLPHFEKMLYDQAMLLFTCLEAGQLTGEDEYFRTAREIITYVLRDMTHNQGGFYSAEDADSEGEEGKFYVWTEAELGEILNPEEKDFLMKFMGVQPGGNFHEEASGHSTGKNILHLDPENIEIVNQQSPENPSWNDSWELIRNKLFLEREKRPRPLRDDKILTDWNGLMIAALARAAFVLNDEHYLNSAQKAADFILKNLRSPGGRLIHRFRDHSAGIDPMVDDYAFFVWGLLELFQAGQDPRYLKAAIDLSEIQIRDFRNQDSGGFWLTSHEQTGLPARTSEFYDGAIPSGNSVTLLNFLKLSKLTGNTYWEDMADTLAKSFVAQVESHPAGYTFFLCALDFYFAPGHEIVLAGKSGSPELDEMKQKVREKYLPNSVLIVNDQKQDLLQKIIPFITDQKPIDGITTAYVCRNRVCNSPVSSVNNFETRLE